MFLSAQFNLGGWGLPMSKQSYKYGALQRQISLQLLLTSVKDICKHELTVQLPEIGVCNPFVSNATWFMDCT